MALVVRNGGAEFDLPMVALCPFRSEELPPGDPIECPECHQPVTPGQQHPVEGEN